MLAPARSSVTQVKIERTVLWFGGLVLITNYKRKEGNDLDQLSISWELIAFGISTDFQWRFSPTGLFFFVLFKLYLLSFLE
jgi:hypothetical protein